MEWNEIGVDGQHTVKFTDLPYVPLISPPQSADADELFVGGKQGGILRHGEWAWLARHSLLQIVSLRNGQTISSYEFCESRGYESCCIKSVEEIFPNNPEIMLLAVVLESLRGPGNGCSFVAVYSVELRTVLSSIELSLHLTCARFIDASACRRSLLQNFDGCLAVGSEEGAIVLLDMNMRKLTSMHNELPEDIFVQCHIVDYSLPLTDIHRNFRRCQQEGIHFGLQMEVIESPCAIKSILPIDLILGLAIGLEDGRLALYDLSELQIFYVALPNPEVTMSSIVKMDFLEPPDDPRPCLFIWTIHENGENLHAVLHSLMYEKRLMAEDESSTYFEIFQTGSVRLQLPLEATKSVALACQTVATFSNHDDDDSNCLCAISWLSVLEQKNKLLIFDLNQWYKEEMPYVVEYGKQPNYLAGFILNGECTGLQALLNPNSIAYFNSMQRFEEHFYPNSLSFESLLLHTEGCRPYNWEGAQNRVINLLRSSNAAIFLEPNFYFNEIIRTRLMPQFIELNVHSTFSRDAKYEILLSAALENNCISLLRDCAKSWIDGSFMGNFSVSTGLSLSTMTDWIWKRATSIKIRCNDLCKSQFEFGGYPLDSREQKELAFITRQLKLLTDLLSEILLYAKKQIPERVFASLETKHNSLSMAASYQEILLWFLNIGLLPEAATTHNAKASDGNDLIPYPYKELKEFYKNKRLSFAKINETFISKKSGSCKLLFIDAFIEHVCKGNVLHEYWMENEGNGLYPPNSLEAMLRVMLVPDLSYENKCAILLYFFLDLNMTIDEEMYKDVVANFIKFPSVFKLSAPLIKTVQAFWNLDHDHYLSAVDEFISPFNKNQCYPQWQVELLIEVLLNQKAINLALRVLESQPSLISPLLKLNTLLANELISEAFHFVRAKNDDELMDNFFTSCLRNGRFGVIRDLALSESEGLILQNILKRSNAAGAESLHFVYLLQKSKYLEAVSYMDELSNKAKGLKAAQMDTPNLVLSAFNTTMTPVTQGLTDVYFRIKNKIKKKEVDNKSPVPLSCQLIKQNANGLLGGIYHSSALSAHFATYYWGEMEEQTKQTKHLLNASNAPFLRRPQIDTNSIDHMAKNIISYPQAYKVTEKRTLLESGVLDNDNDEFERQKLEHKLNPKKKRRLQGQEILQDLSHFMKTNKTSKSLNNSEFTFGPEQTSAEIQPARKNSLDLLTRPSMTKPLKECDNSVAAAVHELHGILKTHTADQVQLQRESLVEEEKNLRFKLPCKDVRSDKRTLSEDAIDDMEIVEEEATTKENVSGSPKDQQISRDVSEEEPNRKRRGSSSSTSQDSFYSPLSSQNNSKLDCSNVSSRSFLSGPQPRKPLARYSAERSEKSVTPTPETRTRDATPETGTKEPVHANKMSPSQSSLKQSKPDCVKQTEIHETVTRSEAYITTREEVFVSKICARKSLERCNPEHLKSIATTGGTASCSEAYITASETFPKPPETFGTSYCKEELVTQTTSGLGSISSQATFARSKINEFSPQISSSKVGATAANKVEETKPRIQAKLSECSTVLEPLTTFECCNADSNIIAATSNVTLDKTKSDVDEQKRRMLETTLSMSTYDSSILDSTSLQQRTSSSMATENDNENKTITLDEEAEEEKEEEEQETQEMESEENLLEIMANTEQTKNDGNETQKDNEESNYDCIVLSSSSSSSSECLQEQENDDYDDDNYSDYDKDVDDNEIDIEDNIEYDDDDNDLGESNESDMSIENHPINDYDEGDDNKGLSIEETDNSTDNENDELIQLIEDSSSDIGEQQENSCPASDSDDDDDDVKLVEDEQSSVAVVDKIESIVSKQQETNKAISTDIPSIEIICVKEVNLEDKDDAEIMENKSEKSPLSPAKLLEKSDSNAAKNSQQLRITTEIIPLDIDVRIDEDLMTSTTKIITLNKSEDLKQRDVDITPTIEDQIDKQDLIKHKPIEEKIDLKAVSSPKSKGKIYEIHNPASPGSKGVIVTVLSVEATEERTAVPFDKPSKAKDNSRELIETASGETDKKADAVGGKSELVIEAEREKSKKKADSVEEKSEQMIATEGKEIKNKVETNKEKSEATIDIESKEIKKNTELVEQKSQLTIEIEKEKIEKKAEIVKGKSELITETESRESKKKADSVEEKSEKISATEGKEIKIKDKLQEKIEKKAEINEEKSKKIIKTESEKKKEEVSSSVAAMDLEIEPDDDQHTRQNKTKTVEETQSEDIDKNSVKQDNEIEVGSSVDAKQLQTESVEVQSSNQKKADGKNKNDKMESKEIEADSAVKSAEHKPASQEDAAGQTSIEKDIIREGTKKKMESKVEQVAAAATPMSAQRKRRASRGSSVPPADVELTAAAAVSTPRRNTRGISVPPQTISESEELHNVTPRTRRNIRASSLQPKYKMEEIEAVTPSKLQKTQTSLETRATIRGSSVPPGAVEGKISTRRRSVLLDAIDEDAIALDSPSTRTRLRSRLNSMDSEVDSPMVAATGQISRQKRTRKTSASNNSVEAVLVTPKRSRRESFTSQSEKSASGTTPRGLRARSILSVQEEDTESIPASPQPTNSRRIEMKRKRNINEVSATESKDQSEQTTPSEIEDSPLLEASYSSSRRLTRTQLAIMEKSVAISEASAKYAMAKELTTPPSYKRDAKSRSTRSSNTNADSDDAESLSSKISTVSSVTGTKRRVTRSSLKGKDDADDDMVSVASSFGSEKHQKGRRSKDKNSPNTTLTTIPEDAPIETKKRGRPAKH